MGRSTNRPQPPILLIPSKIPQPTVLYPHLLDTSHHLNTPGLLGESRLVERGQQMFYLLLGRFREILPGLTEEGHGCVGEWWVSRGFC